MKALRFQSYGPPSVLSVQDVRRPEPTGDEVLVEVHASVINPSDVKFVAGLFEPALPRTPGRDFAGVVVTGEWKGQHVWGSGAGFGVTRDGAHAEYVVVPFDWLSVKPTTLSMEQAATVGVSYVAAWSALAAAGDLHEGDTVLVTGASGAVGRAATQIARWRKARVIGADVTDRALDVDVYVDTRRQDLPSAVSAVTQAQGVDVVVDAVGGPLFEPALKSLGIDGRHVVITSVGRRRVEFDLVDFYHNRQRLIGVDTAKLTGGEIATVMRELREGFEGGHLRAPEGKTWTLEQAVEAYDAVAKGHLAARQVLLPIHWPA